MVPGGGQRSKKEATKEATDFKGICSLLGKATPDFEVRKLLNNYMYGKAAATPSRASRFHRGFKTVSVIHALVHPTSVQHLG